MKEENQLLLLKCMKATDAPAASDVLRCHPKLRIKILLVFFAWLFYSTACFSPLLALDPKKRITQYDIKVYLTKHGLPMNAQKDIMQDSRGFIWVATQEGLLRFDGAGFALFDKKNLPELREYFLWDVAEDWEGNLWLATNGGGVSCFNGKAIIATYDATNGLASNVVFAIAIGKDRTIWLGTENGVTRLRNGVCTNYKFGDVSGPQRIMALHEDRRGNLLIAHGQGGLFVLRNDSASAFPVPEGIFSFFERATGEVILGTGSGKLLVYDHGRVEKFNPHQLPTSHVIRDLHEDREGNLWFSTEGNGIVRYHAGRLETLNVENGLPGYNNFFVRMMEDREGSLWFTSDGGLFQLHDNKFIVLGENEGASKNGNTVCEDKTGNIWAAFRGFRLVQFDEYSSRLWGTNQGLSSNEVTSVIPARGGGIWIGSEGGLHYLKDNKLDAYRIDEKIGYQNIRSLFENQHGELWLGTVSGWLLKFDGKNFKSWRLADGESGDVIAIIETSSGEVWAGTRKQGLYKLSGETVQRLTSKDGISAGGVNAFYEDDERVLWIATDGQGLYRYKHDKFFHFTSRNGLYFDRLFSILEDDQHDLWFSGNRGIFRASKQQLNDLAEGKADTIISQAYNALDGIPETECNGRRQPVAWKSRDGRLWFAAIAGVVCVDPNNMPVNKIPPPVYIEELITNKQRTIMPDSSIFRLEAKERELEFHFTAPSFVVPERVRFKYKLEGYDQTWVEAGARRSAFYTNLPKGDYTFRVIACNNDGIWNEAGASVQLSIAPYWWEMWWAYSLYALAVVAIFLSIRQYEMKRLRLRNELKLQQVRTDRLQELDHLKSRFFAGISHEFRTPLTLIGGPLEEMLAETRNEQQKSQMVMMLRNTQRLQRLVGQLLDLAQLESRKMALQARPIRVVPFLQNLIASFESYAHRKNIKLDFHVNGQLTSEIMFFDPDKMEKVIVNLVANALKYTSSRGSVVVAVGSGSSSWQQGLAFRAAATASATGIEISVRDTGMGIPEKALSHIFDYFYRYRDENTRRESGTGIGLALTKELVELHHGEISVTSQEGVGSEFTIRLPLGKSHLKPEEIASDQLSVISDTAHDPDFLLNLSKERSEQVTSELEADIPAIQPSIDPAIQPSSDQRPLVLLIEDNPDMRNYLREHLNHTNRLLEATNGEEGLQVALAEIPDLIISDVMMPKMDGFELCQKLKMDDLTSHIPVILLTARGSCESKIEGLELGADDYLTKPVSGRELQLRVRNLIELQYKQRAQFRKEIVALDMRLSRLSITSADEKFFNQAMEVLEKHLSEFNFGPEKFAREMTMSRAHLNRKLRGLLGQRTGEFIRTMRLKRAAELLQHKSGTVTEIAYQVGFENLSYFARCFKAQYGQSPHEYGQS